MTNEAEDLLRDYPLGSQDETPVEAQRILLRFYLPMTIRGVETSVPVQAQRDETFRSCLFRDLPNKM